MSQTERKSNSEVIFVVDTRERDVKMFIDSAFTDIQPVVRQLTIGDFHVCRGESVLACIERKTLNDFAQSFGDGRYENVNKLLDLRRRTGCQVYYIIEGPAFPSPDRRFHRIPYSNILAAITKLMVRHGIMIIQTENQEHSAKRLHDLAVALSEEKPYSYPVFGGAFQGKTPDESKGDVKGETKESKMIDGVPAAIMTKIDEPDHERVVKIWAALKGMTVVTGKILSKMFSVAELVSKRIDSKKIDEIKTSTGRQLHKNARKSLMNLRAGMADESARILSKVGGIGWDSAEYLIKEAGGFARFCTYGVGAMSIMCVPRSDGKKIKLGETKAARIIRLLNFVDKPNVNLQTKCDVIKSKNTKVVPKLEAKSRQELKAVHSGEDGGQRPLGRAKSIREPDLWLEALLDNDTCAAETSADSVGESPVESGED